MAPVLKVAMSVKLAMKMTVIVMMMMLTMAMMMVAEVEMAEVASRAPAVLNGGDGGGGTHYKRKTH